MLLNIRRGFIRVTVLCVLTAVLVRPVAAYVPAQNDAATQVTQNANDTIAVLFLIDESGGMNHECKGADYINSVLDIDSETQLRYAIPRFFMSIVGSVYDPEYGSPDRKNLPRISVGVAQCRYAVRRFLKMILQSDNLGTEEASVCN